MKKIIYFLFLVSACFACEEKIDVYHGECGIYFDTKEMYKDTIFIPWGLKNSDVVEQKIALKVKLFGDVASYDREFDIEVPHDEKDTLQATEGVDYLSFPTVCKIPAGQAETTINIGLLRNKDLLNKARRFTVKLKENSELKFIYTREAPLDSAQWVGDVRTRPIDFQRVIYMDERFKVPGWWPIIGPSVFGDYSSKKCILICDVMGISREDFVQSFGLNSAMTEGYLKFVGKYMHKWLQENPQFEEDGSPMQMGPSSRN